MSEEPNPLTVRPTIKLIFDGLLFFCFDTATEDSKQCQVGVLTSGLHHELSVTIIETLTEGPKEKPRYKHSKKVFALCQSTCRMLKDVYLNVKPHSGTLKPVKRYGYGNGTPIDREDTNSYPGNFKWIIDFENGEFNNQKHDITPGVFSPVLHFNTGTFYTQFVNKSVAYDIVRADETWRTFGHVAQTMAANIELEAKDEITLEAPSGNPLWRLNRNPEATYLIHFQNVCPEYKTSLENDLLRAQMMAEAQTTAEFIDLEEKLRNRDDEEKEPEKIQEHYRSDFHYYYDAFRNCSALQHHDFKVKHGSGGFPSICYPGGGSKQQDIS